MKINDYIREKVVYFAFTFAIIALITISSSFAFASHNDYKTYINDLYVTYKDDVITPISQKNIIMVKNIGKERKQFSLYAKVVDSEESISSDKIFYSINSGYENNLARVTNNIIYSGYLNPDESIDLNVNLWLEYDLLDNYDSGKKILIDFEVH